jgi:hypothetical protein
MLRRRPAYAASVRGPLEGAGIRVIADVDARLDGQGSRPAGINEGLEVAAVAGGKNAETKSGPHFDTPPDSPMK